MPLDGLSPERWKRIDALFAAALDLAPEERTAFLERECEGDDALLETVLELLRGASEAEAVIGDSVDSFAASLLADWREDVHEEDRDALPPGSRIGAYRILEEIGRGGMGAVYRAERADGEFDMGVAVKVVKRGMDTDEVLRRFRRERQILASLVHPNIARLLDGGVTEDGRPFLVMENVDGEPITDYCDRHRLGIRERVALFREACHAVDYAHRRLIVHRDIKPANILVTATGTVKLLDFGIAKLLDDSDAGAAAPTRTGLSLLTPEYAAPEQVLGAPVTTATDVYGLGLVLYQLLSGRRAYEFRGRSAVELERAVVDTMPAPPSAAVTRSLSDAEDIARARATTPLSLGRQLRGDLDTIVLTATKKDPNRRYPSAAHLADDLGRYLDRLPVRARPAGFAYRATRFVRRHRAGVAAAALVALSLVTGLGAALWQARHTRQERDVALQVSAFLEDLFRAPDPYGKSPERLDTMRVRAIVDLGAVRVRDELSAQPAIQARMLTVLGSVYRNLALFHEADTLLSQALAIRSGQHGPDHLDVAETQALLALVHRDLGKYERADSLLRAAIATRRIRLGPRHPEVAKALADLGETLRLASRFGEADSVLAEAVDILRARTDRPDQQMIGILTSRANTLQGQGRFAEAEPLRREAVDIARNTLGDIHPQTGVALANLAVLLVELQRLDEAELYLREAIEIYRATVGEEHPEALSAFNTLALLLYDREDYDAAEEVARRSVEVNRRVRGEAHRSVFTALNTLAMVLARNGKLDEAEAAYREALAVSHALYQGDHMQTIVVLNNLGALLRGRGRIDEALGLQQESLAMGRRLVGDEHPVIASLASNVATTLRARGRESEAEALLREALAIRERALAPNHPSTLRSRILLVESLTAQRRFDEADRLARELLDAVEDASNLPGALRRAARAALVALYTAWNRPADADEVRARIDA